MKKMVSLIIFINLFYLFSTKIKVIKIKATSEDQEIVLNENIHMQYLEEALLETTIYDSDLDAYQSYLTSYYDNLTYNLGMNYKGSCGHVAIGMLLSYYDTFLNDSIIPEEYDIISIGNTSDMIERRNSPGIQRDIISNPNDLSDSDYGKTMTAGEYYNHMMSISNQSLHAKLITIGANEGYYDFSDNKLPAGITFSEIRVILEKYLTDVILLDETKFTISYVNVGVRNFVIQNVLNGNPVLLAMFGSNGGHAVIAYDYDIENDLIYCHFGWGANKTHMTTEEFVIFGGALTLELNMEHSHTNNYGVTTVSNNVPNTAYYCYDNCNILTYNHSHFFEGHYCVYCNVSNGSHTYGEPYTWIDYTVHSAVCYCGSVGNQGHAVMGSTPSLGGYKTCIRCGGLAQIGFDFNNPLTTGYKYVSNNGSYISSNGVIILNDLDVDDYLDGSLEFYKDIFNLQYA